MKTLYIVRHAKSSWDDPDLSDEERPLLEKGVKKTHKVIEYLNGHHIRPDLILSSPAVRAFETAKLIAKGVRYPGEKITIMPEIYHFDSAHILRELQGLSDDIQSVMIVGHNPGVTQLAGHLLGKELEWLPTSAIAGIDIHTDQWDRIRDSNVSTRFMIHPSMLP